VHDPESKAPEPGLPGLDATIREEKARGLTLSASDSILNFQCELLQSRGRGR